jgi:hypothetical protein
MSGYNSLILILVEFSFPIYAGDDAVVVGIRRDNNEGISGSGMGTPYNDGNDKDQLPNNGNIGDGVELMKNTDMTNDIVDKEEEVRDTTPTNDFDRDHSTEAPSKCKLLLLF